MAYYIKVTTQVAKKLGHTKDRNTTADGNKLLWQADLNTIAGETIFDRAANVGGVALTAQEAKNETDGCENPVKVYTPEEYMDPIEEVKPDTIPSEEASTEIPPTEVPPTEETAPVEIPAEQEGGKA